MKKSLLNIIVLILIIFISNTISINAQTVIFDFKNKTFKKLNTCLLKRDKLLKIKVVNVNLLKYSVDVVADKKEYKAHNPLDISKLNKELNEKMGNLLEEEVLIVPEGIICESLKKFHGDSSIYKNKINYYSNKVFNVDTENDTKIILQEISELNNLLDLAQKCNTKDYSIDKILTKILSYKSSFETIISTNNFTIEIPNEIGDRFDIKLKFIPRFDKVTVGELEVPLDTIIAEKRIYPKKWSFGLSSGYSLDHFNQNKFFWKDITPDGTFITKTDSLNVYALDSSSYNQYRPSLVTYAHAMYSLDPNFSLGGFFGIGTHFDNFSPDFHFGVSFAFLKNHRFILNIGNTFGLRTTGITEEININNTYNHTSKENYDLTNETNLIKAWTFGVCTIAVTFQIF